MSVAPPIVSTMSAALEVRRHAARHAQLTAIFEHVKEAGSALVRAEQGSAIGADGEAVWALDHGRSYWLGDPDLAAAVRALAAQNVKL